MISSYSSSGSSSTVGSHSGVGSTGSGVSSGSLTGTLISHHVGSLAKWSYTKSAFPAMSKVTPIMRPLPSQGSILSVEVSPKLYSFSEVETVKPDGVGSSFYPFLYPVYI